jgi:hypothetical protein
MVHGPPAEQIFFVHSKTSYSYISNQTSPQIKVLLEKQIDWQSIVLLAKKFSQLPIKSNVNDRVAHISAAYLVN